MSDYVRSLRERIGNTLIVMPCVTAVIPDERGRLLMARHAGSGLWGTPGGAVDPHESPAAAVAREVREETSLIVSPGKVLGAWGGPDFFVTYSNGDQCSYVMIAIECRIIGGEMCPDDDEIEELRWVEESELSGLATPRWGRELLPMFFAHVAPHSAR